MHPCPCCENHSLPEPAAGAFAICPVCGWEDDVAQLADPDFAGGANRLSLREARAAYQALALRAGSSQKG